MMSEDEMRECLQRLFITLLEASKECEPELLPEITQSMLDVYSIFRTIRL